MTVLFVLNLLYCNCLCLTVQINTKVMFETLNFSVKYVKYAFMCWTTLQTIMECTPTLFYIRLVENHIINIIYEKL